MKYRTLVKSVYPRSRCCAIRRWNDGKGRTYSGPGYPIVHYVIENNIKSMFAAPLLGWGGKTPYRAWKEAWEEYLYTVMEKLSE